MIKEAIKYIVGLDRETLKEVNGFKFLKSGYGRVIPPAAESIIGSTLDSIVDYCNQVAAADKDSALIVRIVSPSVVKVDSILDEKERVREKYFEAQIIRDTFRFDDFMSVDKFIIRIQAMFKQDPTTAQILKLVGNLSAEATMKVDDDGVSQSTTAKTGVTTIGEVSVPNPVLLAPYRTFTEIEQPESMFVFRMEQNRSTIDCALFEADGGAWKVEAIASIKKYLTDNIEEGKAIILA